MAESISDPSVSYSMSSSDDDSDCDPVANHETSGSEMTQMRAKQVDVPSLLDRLKCPASSELPRKRVMKKNPTKRKRSRGAVAAEPLSISPRTRIKEFPDEKLSVASGKLFCTACRENVSLKKSVVLQHIKSVKHTNGKESIEKNELRERKISDMLKQYDKQHHPIGETLSDDARVYRIKVVSTFLKAGVPLSKVDYFRSLLEERGFRLSDSSNLYQLIPFLHEEEKATIKKEINERELSIIFDGTTYVCEALVIVVRFVNEHWMIQQRLVRLMLLAKSLTGEELARQLIVCLSTELGIASNLVVAAMRDRASVNTVAVRTFKHYFPTNFRYRVFFPHFRSCWRADEDTYTRQVYERME